MESVNNRKQSSSSSGNGLNSDPTWECIDLTSNSRGQKVFSCRYCGYNYQGEAIDIMRYHLAGFQAKTYCKKVPKDISGKIYAHLMSIEEREEERGDMYNEVEEDESEELSLSSKPRQKYSCAEKFKGKRKAMACAEDYMVKGTTPMSKLGIKNALVGKEAIQKAHMALARWFFDAGIPFAALQSPYFQSVLDSIAGLGSGYRGPSYNSMRNHLLFECKKECQLLIDSHRNNWAKSGCTIMGDTWSNEGERTFINFLVYCSSGVTFVKSVDASDIIKDAASLCNLFSEIIEWVGPSNVVHLVTNNSNNYAVAGSLLHEKYKHIYWSPCAAHCLNLVLKDIIEMDHMDELAKRASKVTKFIYNHIYLLSWLRKRSGWKEIVHPGKTHYATVFITLENIYKHKHDLQALVTSKYYTSHRLSKCAVGKAVSAIILDNKFWEDCLLMVNIGAPIIKLLRVVDVDEKPSLGYIYEGMHRIRKGIMSIFRNKQILYNPYIKSIDERWNKHLCRGIHAAAYFLNPAFMYGQTTFIETLEVMQGLLDVLENKGMCDDGDKAIKEIKLYRERLGIFSRELALKASKTTEPDEWWRLFGHSAPVLQKVAIRILSQTASSWGFERNWSFFERIHKKRRNRLEHQRLNDLVYVTYNLRLKNRHQYEKRNYDPIDYECIDKMGFWIAEEQELPPPELDYDEIMEQAIYDDDAMPILDDGYVRDDKVVLGEIGSPSKDDLEWRNAIDDEID